MITIHLTDQQCENLLRLLGKLPHDDVAQLIAEIRQLRQMHEARMRGDVGQILQMRPMTPEDYGPIEAEPAA